MTSGNNKKGKVSTNRHWSPLYELSSVLIQNNRFSFLNEEKLIGWIRDAFEQAFAKVSPGSKDASLIVKELPLDISAAPYWMFDTPSVQDIHFITGAERFIVGLGVAREWVSRSESALRDMGVALKLEHIPRELSEKVFLMGGCAFPSGAMRYGGVWKDFSESRWVLPALTLVVPKNGKDARLTLAISLENSASPLTRKKLQEYYENLMKALVAPPGGVGAATNIVRLWNRPSRRRWVSLVRRALESLGRNDLKKVVLARSVEILFDHGVSCSRALENLAESNTQSTIFAVKRAHSVFMGATPERLLSLKNGDLKVDCLAASTSRASDVETDASLGRELLKDKKSRYEHGLVVEQVSRSLSKFCSEIWVPENPGLKKLPTVQHLHTIVLGRLKTNVSIWTAAQALWPTSAVGGEPKEEAVKWIKKFEGRDRGWYSGLIGCVSASGRTANFLVSIRSGIIRGKRAFLFAGAGIVPQSDPKKEFEETLWKMEPMLRALAPDACPLK